MALLPIDETSQRGNVSLVRSQIVNRCDGKRAFEEHQFANQRWPGKTILRALSTADERPILMKGGARTTPVVAAWTPPE